MTTRSILYMLCGLALLTWLCLGPAMAQPTATLRCGPAAAIITTPQQQAAAVASLRPVKAQNWTTVREGRIPYVVYDDGRRYPLMPLDDYLAERKKHRGSKPGGDQSAGPDTPQTVALTVADLPWSDFVNLGDWVTPVRNQQGRGTCHVYGATAVVETLIKRRMMARGVPAQLAEMDLSEEWLTYHAMKHNSDYRGSPKLSGDGGFGDADLLQIADKAYPPEAYWPYDPESWPKAAGKYPCAAAYARDEAVEWEYWAHRQPGQLTPSSIGYFRDHTSPAGPLPDIRARDVGVTGDPDEVIAKIKERIRDDKPVSLGVAWPTGGGGPLWDGVKLFIPPGYPMDLHAKIDGGQKLRPAEQTRWDAYYDGAHEFLVFGFGKSGTKAEGLFLAKNSHGIGSGQYGYLFLTENFIRLSYPVLHWANLANTTVTDIDRFAETMKQR